MQESELLKKTYITLKKTQQRLAELEQEKTEPIAVIGMACRFPGGANDPDAFWELLKNGVDASSEIPETRWSSRYFDTDPKTDGTTHASRANLLTQPIDQFDAPFFSISAKEANSLDPQQRLLLEVVWEGLEDAALDVPSLNGSRTSVFAGISSDDYTQSHRHSGNRSRIDGYSLTGTCFAPASGRISYTFGFQGPSVAIDTACSSSLVGLHLACRSLLEKESDLAVAGGVNLILSPIFHICSTKLGTISPDGRCKTFDESANGYGRGEGCGILVLRRLSDALKENDRILAVVRSTAVNQDGKSNGLTAPNGLAQEALIKTALKRVGLSGGDIGYFEAHGTGTPLGDPIELEAIARVIEGTRTKENPVFVSSVKTNIGHLEAAAGVSGAIKVIQSLRHAQIPPHLHLNNPSHHIPWDTLPIKVPTELTPWQNHTGNRRAGVSSFGFSGTNAHAIFEEAPEPQTIADDTSPVRPYHLLPISARTEEALKEYADRYTAYFQQADIPKLSDICYTAGIGRTHFQQRIAIAAQSHDAVFNGLQSYRDNNHSPQLMVSSGTTDRPKIAFLYTGQGAQYTGMGRNLFNISPVFHHAITECDGLFQEWYHESLIEVIYGSQTDEGKLAQTKYTQPATFAIQYALTQLWRQWGIEADIITGHSIGEFAAGVAAGILPLHDAFHLVAERGRIMQALPANGGMLAVMADETDIADVLNQHNGNVAIAALNAPQSIVLSGANGILLDVSQRLKEKGITSKPLQVSHAFHSPLMNQAADEFAEVAKLFQYALPERAVISTVTGNRIHDGEYRSADYWAKQILQPVRFRNAVASVAQEGARLFVEIGPGSTLSGLAIRCIPMENKFFLASLSQKENDWKQILPSLGRLYVEGVDVNWKGVDQPFTRRKVSLPHYPFQRKTYYMQPLFDTADGGSVASTNLHPLLGQKVVSPILPKDTILFQAAYQADKPSFLKQHVIFGKIISPAAAHISHALSAGSTLFGDRPRAVEDISFTNPLVVEDDDIRTVQTVVREAKSKHPSFELMSCSESSLEDWHTHSAGTLAAIPGSERPAGILLDEIKERCPNRMTLEEFYQYIENAGYTTGPHFQCIRDIYKGNDESLCQIRTGATFADNAIHPGLIDSILQTVLPGCEASASEMLSGDNILIPLHMNAVRLYGSLKGDLYCHNKVQVQPDVIKSNIHVVNDKGETVLVIQDFLLRKTTRETLYRDLAQNVQPLLYQVDWVEAVSANDQAAALESSNTAFFIAGAQNGLGGTIADELKIHNKTVFTMKRTNNLAQDIHQLTSSLKDALQRAAQPLHILYMWQHEQDDLSSCASGDIAAAEQALCESILAIIHTLQSVPSSKAIIWIITKNAFAIQPDERSVSPVAQSLWGLGRTIAMESPDIWGGLIDFDSTINSNTAQTILNKILQPDGEDQIAVRKGSRVFAARLSSCKNKPEQSPPTLPLPALTEDEAYYLDVNERGTLDGLAFKTRARKQPGANEIEIHLHVSGLNFRDVLNALGQYPGDAGQLGFECGGVVFAVGTNVTDIRVGDEVIVMAPQQGCMANYITVDQSLVVKKPQGMNFIQAVTLPATFLTAYYALHVKGTLNKGNKILIHAGAGGVGMAAVQLAKHFGAEVFATAGSDEKREFLKSMGVDHALNSRTLDFADDIQRITNGSGVNFILNSLSGEFIDKSFSVLASNGWFLEMGKIGIWSREQAQRLDPTIHYHPFDLAAIAKEDPGCIRRIWDELMELFALGKLVPLSSVVFPLDEAAEAFRYMAQAKHIGKIVFTREQEIQKQSIQQRGIAHEYATYLITGGLGALGLLTAEWLAEQGVKSIVLTSRSHPKPAAEERIAALRAHGLDVSIALGDVAIMEDVQKILSQIQSLSLPLKGIIHAAGLLRDGMMTEQTWERFQEVLSPKVSGAWNLHHATQSMSLDFFVLFSSVACLIGNMGQSNYSTANSFLDGLASARRRMGLPAVSINWGPWADAGMAANLESNPFERQGIRNLKPETGFKAMQHIIEHAMTQCCVFDVNWDTYIHHHDLADRTKFYSLVTTQTAGVAGTGTAASSAETKQSWQQELLDVMASQRRAHLIELLQRLCRTVLGYSESDTIYADTPLTEQGFDSLMTVDVRNRLMKLTGASLSASLLFDYPTLNRLADYLLKEVIVFDDTEHTQDSSTAAQPVESILSEIDDLLMAK